MSVPTSLSSDNLAEALARLNLLTDWERRPRNSMRVGLGPIRDLSQRLANPHVHFRAVHVAGTKGKGSICALIEAGLLRAGYRIGRYSSPHVEHISERISILGQAVGEADLAFALMQTLDHYEAAKKANTEGSEATWFDVLTAAAFVIFRKFELDWVVVEVGLGGRLDSTNVVDAEVAVITNVELEHTEILGATREAIAHEKVGILKPGATLITPLAAADAAGKILQQRADRLGCPVLRTRPAADVAIAQRNAELAGLVLDHLGRHDLRTRSRGVPQGPVGAWLLDSATRAKARLPGRLERFDVDVPPRPLMPCRSVPVVFDGAHVPFNLAAVMRDLAHEPGLDGPCVAIIALAADKDAAGFLAVLSQRVRKCIFTELQTSTRAHSAANLCALAIASGLTCETEPDPRRAFARGVELAGEARGWLLVAGSLYLVGAMRSFASAGET
jgi:dihydrofolate synthase/folylpolyglutamate synthase